MNIFALVIDDDREVVERTLQEVRNRLTDIGHSFVYAIRSDVQDAVETFGDWKNVDVIWLDLIGVIQDGNLARGLAKSIPLIRRSNRLAPLLVVSKQTAPDVIIQAIDLGASSYVLSNSLPTGAPGVYGNDVVADNARWRLLTDKLLRLAERYRAIKQHISEPRPAGVFRKTGAKASSATVKRQFNYLDELMQFDDLRGLFPEIVGPPSEVEESFSYETTYFELPTLRSLLFRMRDQAEMLKVGEMILVELVTKLVRGLYSRRVATPDRAFIKTWYVEKFERRQRETKELLVERRRYTEEAELVVASLRDKLPPADLSRLCRALPTLTDLQQLEWLLNAESITLAGVALRMPGEILGELMALPEFCEMVTPPRTSWIHGDLHLGNILVDYPHPEIIHLKLIDPGGYLEGHDPAYDLGKLFLSLDGEYDFIHEGHLTIGGVVPNSDTRDVIADGLVFTEWATVALGGGLSGDVTQTLKKEVGSGHRYVFGLLATRLIEIVGNEEYFQSDPHWQLRARFHAALQCCTVARFHVADNPKRAATLVLRGVDLMNQFYRLFKSGVLR